MANFLPAACPGTCSGLRQCSGFSSFVTCCNYYERDGSCTPLCSSPTVPQLDNTCDCPLGTTGVACDVPVNFCDPSPCMNMGTCSNSGSTFNCTCPAGYQGETCGTDINECNTTLTPCLNGGTCQNNMGSFACQCLGNWGGQDCGRCDISNCVVCSPDGSRCLSCVDGYAINDQNTCCKYCNKNSFMSIHTRNLTVTHFRSEND